MGLNFSKRRRFKNVSVTLEEETEKELITLKEEFKNITKTEIMRFAIEYALQSKEFKKILDDLNSKY